jgi:hypothetical protein
MNESEFRHYMDVDELYELRTCILDHEEGTSQYEQEDYEYDLFLRGWIQEFDDEIEEDIPEDDKP